MQLYSLRDVNEPLPQILHHVAEAGFEGVEFAHRVHHANPMAVRDALDETGLVPVAAHVELHQLLDDWDRLLSLYDTLEVDMIVLPHLPFDHFRTTDRINELVNRLQQVEAALDDRGKTLAFHNTREVFYKPLDGYQIPPALVQDPVPTLVWVMVAELMSRDSRGDYSHIERSGLGLLSQQTEADQLRFEMDIKNVVAAGVPVEDVFDILGDRIDLVHLSDIAQTRRWPPTFESVDPGDGLVDLSHAIDVTLGSEADWLIFEHDRPPEPFAPLEQADSVLDELLTASTPTLTGA